MSENDRHANLCRSRCTERSSSICGERDTPNFPFSSTSKLPAALCFICYCWERSKGGSLSLTIHFTCSIYTQDWCSIEDENSRFPPLQNVDSDWRPPRGDICQRVNLEEEKKSAGCMWVEKERNILPVQLESIQQQFSCCSCLVMWQWSPGCVNLSHLSTYVQRNTASGVTETSL